MISATELAQIAAPARSTGFSTFSGSLGSAKIFSRGASESRGASNGRTSGQLFLAASRAQLPTQRALDSPVYGLSSAPSRGSWARDGAQAEHRTCHWHGLAPVAAALPSAYRPLQAMATVFTMPSIRLRTAGAGYAACAWLRRVRDGAAKRATPIEPN